jgi:dUTP pyrophosphatase
MILKVKKLDERAIIPEYATKGSVAFDVCALEDALIISGMPVVLIRTGLAFSIPEGYEIQVRQRSGLSLKHANYLANCIGTIDSDYRGELKIPISLYGRDRWKIKKGDRIAQCLLKKAEIPKLVEVEELDETERGSGGFGHTGK